MCSPFFFQNAFEKIGLFHCFSSRTPFTYNLVGLAPQNRSHWANLTDSEDNVSFYLTVYGCLAGSNSIFTLLRAFLFAYGGIRAAKVLHHRLLASVLKVGCDSALLVSCHLFQ